MITQENSDSIGSNNISNAVVCCWIVDGSNSTRKQINLGSSEGYKSDGRDLILQSNQTSKNLCKITKMP